MAATSIYSSKLLNGKTALITGGGTGIGFEIARTLGELGAHVIIAARTVSTLEKAVSSLQKDNIQANFKPVNIRNEQEVSALFETIKAKWGLCDILVNNAGGQFAAQALDISPNGFRAVVDLNLQGTWQMSQMFARHLIEAGQTGRIINIVLSLKSGLPGMVHAGAARAGVVNMTKTLAYEWGPYGVTVNAIAPGMIETTGLTHYDADHLNSIVKRLPIKRMGTPREVAHAAAYLVSPAGDFITGTTLEIDGGEHLLGAVNQL